MVPSCQETVCHSWPLLGTCWESGMARNTLHMLSQFTPHIYRFRVIFSAMPWCTGRKMRLRKVPFPRSPCWSLVGIWGWLLERISRSLRGLAANAVFSLAHAGNICGSLSMSLPLFLFTSNPTLHPVPPSFLPTEHTISSFISPHWYHIWSCTLHQIVSKILNGQWWENE